jgi:hypothetical protein
MKSNSATMAFAALLLVAAPACKRTGAQRSARSEEAVVALVAGQPVTFVTLQAQLDHLSPPVRERYAKLPEERAQLLQRLINNEVLAGEARRLGYDKDPEVVDAAKKAMVMKVLRTQIGEGPSAAATGPAAVQAYYDAHRDEFGGRPLQEVSAQIAHKLSERERDDKLDALIAKLRRDLGVEVFDEQLGRLDFGATPAAPGQPLAAGGR